MEILGYLSSFLVAILLASVVVQLIYSYALQCLASKNDMSTAGQVLAWVPILNIYPFIVCGGGSFPRFLIGTVVFFAGGIGLGFLSSAGGAGSVASAVIAVAGMLGMIFYFGRLLWRTAERRGLNGFIGLLGFVPVVNLFVYPYIS